MSPHPTAPAVIVDPFSSGALYAPAFAAAGVPVVAVSSTPRIPDAYRPGFRPELFTEVVPHDGDDAPVLDRLARLRPRCVLPGAETGVELADRLAARLTPGLANAGTLPRRDKYRTALAVAGAGLPGVRQIATDDPAAVREWIAREGLAGHDLVVKPTASAGTDGVVRVPGGTGWEEPFGAQLGRTNAWGTRNDTMLVQEYVTGVEYVVDLVSLGGRHTVTDVCRYAKVDNAGQMAVYAAMEWVRPDDPVVGPLVGYATAVLDATGLRTGPSHVEIMLTADGPRLIEVNARAHGGGQPEFCDHATGDGQITRTVRLLTGGTAPDGYRLDRPTTVVFLVARASGVVRGADRLTALSGLRSCLTARIAVRDGDRLEPTRDLLGTLGLGFVVLSHPDPDVVAADVRRVRAAEAGLHARLEPIRVAS